MILLVADRLDTQARWLAERWTMHDARILTPRDLSQPGWNFRPGSSCEWTGIADGRCFDKGAPLNGVLNCISEVTGDQLLHIAPEDRSYVAHEMTAFLLSWESELTCPVLNRPAPDCLMGPNFSREEWTLTAARLGLPVKTITRTSHGLSRSVQNDPFQNARSITVIRERLLGEGQELRYWAGSLALAAHVDLATFYFSRATNAEFLGATLRPDLANAEAADALLQCFEGVRTC